MLCGLGTKRKLLICFLGVCFLFFSFRTSAADDDRTFLRIPKRLLEVRPEKNLIVGVVTNPMPTSENSSLTMGFIDATYVDLLTKYNVSVIPIYHDLTQSSLNVLFDRIDGIVIPGGPGALLNYNKSDDQTQSKATSFTRVGKFLKNLIYHAVNINKVNGTFPIYGICLGAEALGLAFSDDLDILQPHVRWDKKDQLAPVKFVADQQSSKLISGLPSSLKSKMESSDSHLFHHEFGLDYPRALNNSLFKGEYNILATAKDIHGLEYVAIMESKTHPFFGTQFHTNRIQDSKNKHLQEEIQDYFFKFFLNQANKRERSRARDNRLVEKFGLTKDQKRKISGYNEGDVYVVDFSDFPTKNNVPGSN